MVSLTYKVCGSVTKAGKSPSAKGSGRYSKGIVTRISRVDKRLNRLVERLRLTNTRVAKLEALSSGVSHPEEE